MAQNPLRTVNNSYADIMAQINGLMAADPRFPNLRESDVGQFNNEMFAGVTDIILYMLQRRSEECYYDTAQLRSSVTTLSRMFSYDITRPIPAQSKLKIVVKGPLVVAKDDKIQVPYMTKFNANASDFVLLQTMTYNVSQTDSETLAAGGTIEITQDSFGNDITIVQGVIKERVIEGSTNYQVGSTFQSYLIDDSTFSDLYGTPNDIFFNDVTRVYVGSNKYDGPLTDPNATSFQIDRRSLINWENIANSKALSSNDAARICMMRTDKAGGVEVKFGDDLFARMGAKTQTDNVYVQYLSTQGSAANKIGVIGNKVTMSGKIYTNKGLDITSKVTYELYGNIINGADVESIESIKNYSPKIYYSLDRIVSKDDYINYLKTLTTPVLIKNAIAWGEQEQKERDAFSDIKSFNIAFFSVLGSLYNIDSSPNPTYTVKTGSDLDSAVLDVGYTEGGIQDQCIFNVYTRQLMAKQLKQYRNKDDWFKVIYGVKQEGFTADEFEAIKLGGNQGLTFTYKAYDVENSSNIQVTDFVICDLNTGNATDTQSVRLGKVAASIQTAINALNDKRGNETENGNYGRPAFGGCIVRFEESTITVNGSVQTTYPRLVIEFNKISNPCYITLFSTGTLADYCMLSDVNAIDVWYSASATPMDYDNGKINTVVKKLDDKCTVTTTNIYTSPTVHSFKAIGDVYVKPLYDKEDIKRQLSNTVYTWLDQNADFGVNIRSSNIIEMYETNNAVQYLTFDIVPEGKNYFISDTYDFRQIWLSDSLVPYPKLTGALNTAAYPYYALHGRNGQVASPKIEMFTEREFYEGFCKTAWKNILPYLTGGSLYDAEVTAYVFGSPTATISSDLSPMFVNLLENVKRTWDYSIKANMINTYGNIELANNKGGYSMGNEIVKLDVSTLNYLYK